MITCASHTMHRLPHSDRLNLIQLILKFLSTQMSHPDFVPNLIDSAQEQLNYLVCFTARATTFDSEYESWRSSYALWKLIRSKETQSNTDGDDDPGGGISKLVCCVLTGRCSNAPNYSRISSKSSFRDMCLARILNSLIEQNQDPSVKTPELGTTVELFRTCLNLCRSSSLTTQMITLSCLIGGWTTLGRFAHQLFTHLHPISIMDYLLSALYSLSKNQPSMKSHLVKLLLNCDKSSKTNVSSPMLLLMASCWTDRGTSWLSEVVDLFLSSSTCTSNVSTHFYLAPYLAAYIPNVSSCYGVSELGQSFAQTSVGRSSVEVPLPFSVPTNYLPAGISAPLQIFNDTATKYWAKAYELTKLSSNYMVSNCVNTNLAGKSENGTGSLIDFASDGIIYSDQMENELRSLCAASVAARDQKVTHATFPLFIGATSLNKVNDVFGMADASAEPPRESDNAEAFLCPHTNFDFTFKEHEDFLHLTVRFRCLIILQRIKLFSPRDSDDLGGSYYSPLSPFILVKHN